MTFSLAIEAAHPASRHDSPALEVGSALNSAMVPVGMTHHDTTKHVDAHLVLDDAIRNETTKFATVWLVLAIDQFGVGDVQNPRELLSKAGCAEAQP